MKKRILYIDMDGVVADFDGKVEELCPNLVYEKDLSKRKELIDETVANNGSFFYGLVPILGSIEVVDKLFDHYEVYFLSTPMWDVPESYTAKRIWLEHHFGKQTRKRLVLTHRKDLLIGDYLVDDRIIHGVDFFQGKHIHFGSPQFPNWEIVFQFLVKCHNEHTRSL